MRKPIKLDGRINGSRGYIWLFRPYHPMANSRGYVPEHRFVMSENLGRNLLRMELVHHINGDKKDNRIENLELTDRASHTSHHLKGKTKPKYHLKKDFPN